MTHPEEKPRAGINPARYRQLRGLLLHFHRAWPEIRRRREFRRELLNTFAHHQGEGGSVPLVPAPRRPGHPQAEVGPRLHHRLQRRRGRTAGRQRPAPGSPQRLPLRTTRAGGGPPGRPGAGLDQRGAPPAAPRLQPRQPQVALPGLPPRQDQAGPPAVGGDAGPAGLPRRRHHRSSRQQQPRYWVLVEGSVAPSGDWDSGASPPPSAPNLPPAPGVSTRWRSPRPGREIGRWTRRGWI